MIDVLRYLILLKSPLLSNCTDFFGFEIVQDFILNKVWGFNKFIHTVPSSVKIIWSWTFLKWIDNLKHQIPLASAPDRRACQTYFLFGFGGQKCKIFIDDMGTFSFCICACQILCKYLALVKWIFDQSTSKHPFSKSFSNTLFEPNTWCQHRQNCSGWTYQLYCVFNKSERCKELNMMVIIIVKIGNWFCW